MNTAAQRRDTADTADTGSDDDTGSIGDDSDAATTTFPVGERRTELLECVIEDGGCDMIATPNAEGQILVPGPGYWAHDGLDHAGETICIPAGEYSHMNFHGLKGTEEQPITITNCGAGQVVVDAEGKYPALTSNKGRYLHFTGTGDPDTHFGFLTKNPGTGLAVIDMKEGTSDIEIDHFEVTGTAYSGIAIRTYPYCDADIGRESFSQHNTVLHHNYVHDIDGEGFYIGPSHYHLEYSPTTTDACSPGCRAAFHLRFFGCDSRGERAIDSSR